MFETAKKNQKTTDVIIDQIRDVILSGKLKPGDRLASEKELIEQFGVAKATLREALRALEVMGFVQTRKGAAGGIYITEVNLQTTIHSMMNFLHFRSLSVSEITMVRYMIEPMAVSIAAEKITAKEIEHLKILTLETGEDNELQKTKNIGFHRYLSRITGNTMLILVVDILESLINEIKQVVQLETDFYTMVSNAHQEILNFLIKGDTAAASAAMATDVIMVGRHLAGVLGEDFTDPSGYRIGCFPVTDTPAPAKAKPKQPAIVQDYSNLATVATANLNPEDLANAKVLRSLDGADLYLIVPHATEETKGR